MKILLWIILLFQTSLFGELNLEKQWQYNTDASIKAKPLIYKNHAYLSSYDGNLYKLDIKNGKKVWNFQTKHLISSSALVENNKVFIGSGDNYFYAVDAKSGAKIWEYKTDDMITRSCVIYKNMVIFGGADGHIYALDKKDGKLIWKKDLGSSISADLLYANRILYVATIDKKVHAINIKNRKTLWTYTMPERATTKPIYDDAILYVADEDSEVVAIDTNDGSKIWAFQTLAGVKVAMQIRKNNLYVASSDYTLYMLDKSTGKITTSYLASDDISAMIISKKFIILGTSTGYLLFLDTNGSFIEAKKVDTEITSLLVGEDRLYVTDTQGNLYQFSNTEEKPVQILTPPPPPKIENPVNKTTSGISTKDFEKLLKDSKVKYKKISNWQYRLKTQGMLSLKVCKKGRCNIAQLSSAMGSEGKSRVEKLKIINSFNKEGTFTRATLDKDNFYHLHSELDLSTDISVDDIKIFIIIHANKHGKLSYKI